MRTTLFAEEVVVSLSKLQLRQLEAQRSRFLETCGKSDDSHATLVDLAQVTSVVGSDISADLCTLCFQIFDTNESGKIDWRRFLLGIVGIGGVFGPQNWTSQHTQFVFETFARQDHNGMRYNEFQTLICMTQGLDDELTRIGSGPEAQDACFFGDSVSATDIAKWLWRSGYTAHGKDGSLSLRQFRQATREYWHFGNLSRLLGDPLGEAGPTALPVLRLNGAMMPRESLQQSVGKRSGNMTWIYHRIGPIVLSDLQVELHDVLKKRVQEAGARVRADVRLARRVNETFFLSHENNFSVEWPKLESEPLSIYGLQLQLTQLDGLTEMAAEDAVLGDESVAERVDADSLDSEGPNEGVQGRRLVDDMDEGIMPEARESCWQDLDSPEEGVAGDAFRENGSAASPSPQASKRPRIDVSPLELNKRRAGPGGRGKGLMVSLPPPSAPVSNGGLSRTPSGLSQACGVPPQSPMGHRATAWKLANHTVRLNRHQGTVEDFEKLWEPSARRTGDDDWVDGNGVHSAPHTPRSYMPETPQHSDAGWGSPRQWPSDPPSSGARHSGAGRTSSSSFRRQVSPFQKPIGLPD